MFFYKPVQLKKGIAFVLFAWLMFTVLTGMTRYTSKVASVPMILFFQNLISLIFVVPWLIKHHYDLKPKRFGLIIVRALTGVFGFGFLFLAVQKISLTNTMLLNNSAPLLVPILAYFWLKAPINHKLWPGIIIGFIGIILILHPTKAIMNPGAFLALGGACMLAVAMLALRLLSASDKGHTVLFYYFALGALFTLPLCIIYWEPLTTSSIIQLIILGVLSAIGQYAFVHAFHYAKTSQLGPFCYVSVVYAALIDWFLWGSIPDYLAIIGIILVCIGGILTILFSRPKEKLMQE